MESMSPHIQGKIKSCRLSVSSLETCKLKEKTFRSSRHGSAKMNLTSIHEDWGSFPSLAQWVKGPVLLWAVRRSKTRLWSCVAMAVAVVQASSCSSDLTPSLGTPYAAGMALKSTPPQKKRERERFTKIFRPLFLNHILISLVLYWKRVLRWWFYCV